MCQTMFAATNAGGANERYDLVLSSGFLAFANHSGFLQAVEEVSARGRGTGRTDGRQVFQSSVVLHECTVPFICQTCHFEPWPARAGGQAMRPRTARLKPQCVHSATGQLQRVCAPRVASLFDSMCS